MRDGDSSVSRGQTVSRDVELVKQLARLADSVDAMREDLSEMKANQAAGSQAMRDIDRRITLLESDTRTAFWLAIGGLLTWSGSVLVYLMTGKI